MPRSHTQRRAKQSPLVPRVKVWLETDGRYAFGLGLSDILQAVDRTGSIKQAACDVRKSYRHVWGRIKQAEAALGQRLVQTQVGGKGSQRSALTEAARRLVAGFLLLRDRMVQLVEEEFTRQVPSHPPPDHPNSTSERGPP
jgi:molybdate transport system regulatory protein